MIIVSVCLARGKRRGGFDKGGRGVSHKRTTLLILDQRFFGLCKRGVCDFRGCHKDLAVECVL